MAGAARPPAKCAIYQYQSTGIFRQNQLVLNTTIRAGAKVMLNGYYTLNYADSDTSGVNSSPSIPMTCWLIMAAQHSIYGIAPLWAARLPCAGASAPAPS